MSDSCLFGQSANERIDRGTLMALNRRFESKPDRDKYPTTSAFSFR
jgi:hypothetical protein